MLLLVLVSSSFLCFIFILLQSGSRYFANRFLSYNFHSCLLTFCFFIHRSLTSFLILISTISSRVFCTGVPMPLIFIWSHVGVKSLFKHILLNHKATMVLRNFLFYICKLRYTSCFIIISYFTWKYNS
jgi:hypothetical protein